MFFCDNDTGDKNLYCIKLFWYHTDRIWKHKQLYCDIYIYISQYYFTEYWSNICSVVQRNRLLPKTWKQSYQPQILEWYCISYRDLMYILKKVLQVWNDLKIIKRWQTFLFFPYYSFNWNKNFSLHFCGHSTWLSKALFCPGVRYLCIPGTAVWQIIVFSL